MVSTLRQDVRGDGPKRLTHAVALWLLLALFLLRVAGQLAVVAGVAPFLPPMEAWYSGLVPYGPLLVSQLVIVAVLAKVSTDVTRGTGYFAAHRGWIARQVRWFGWVYAATMLGRYGVTMAFFPARRWTGGIIPIVFHLVLAGYLLVLANYSRHAAAAHDRHH